MAEYREYISALRQCAKEHEKDKLYTGQINTSDLCSDTAELLEKLEIGINKAIEEIEQTLYVDSLIFGELIDFKNGKISADDVIEEFNKVTRKEVLEILKRNIGE